MNQRTYPAIRTARLGALACALSLGVFAQQAAAQSSEVSSAAVRTCGVGGSVTVSVLGLTTTLPLSCVGQAQRTNAGSDDSSVADIELGLLGIVDVIKLSAAHQSADYTLATGATALDGASEAAGVSLIQDIVTAEGVRGSLSCDSLSGSTRLHCQAGTTVARVRLGGGDIVNLPSPLPRDFTVPIGATLRLTVLGIPITVPVGGSLILNQSRAAGVGSRNVLVTHQPAQLGLGGSVSVGGLGLVAVRVEATASPSVISVNATRPVTAVTIDEL